MKYKTQKQIDNTLFKANKNIKEEDVIRDIICNMIKEIPIQDLKKLFNVELLNPSRKDLFRVITTSNQDPELIHQLLEDDCRMYSAEIIVAQKIIKQYLCIVNKNTRL